MKWWEGFLTNNHNFDFHAYKVGETEVVISKRRDQTGMPAEYFSSVDAFLVVTESFVPYPVGKTMQWFPWMETMEKFPESVVYSSIKTLHYWIDELKLKRIYIHCDLGSHRAPSVFGAYLFAYHRENFKQIAEDVIFAPVEKSYYRNPDDGTCYSNPWEYFNSKIGVLPNMPYFIDFMVKYPNLDLEGVKKGYRETLPYELRDSQEKKEFRKEKKEQAVLKKASKWLRSQGFEFKEISRENKVQKESVEHLVLIDTLDKKEYPEVSFFRLYVVKAEYPIWILTHKDKTLDILNTMEVSYEKESAFKDYVVLKIKKKKEV